MEKISSLHGAFEPRRQFVAVPSLDQYALLETSVEELFSFVLNKVFNALQSDVPPE
jgi:hypothetical protein